MSRYFGAAIQTAFVVRNIDEHMKRCLEVGIGPFFVIRNLMLNMRYRGVRREVPVTVAVAYSGSMMYEYIEQHDDTPSPYHSFLADSPEGGLHHLAYYCDDYDEVLAEAKSRGGEFDVVMELYTPDGIMFEIYVEPKNHPEGILSQLIKKSLFDSFFEDMEAVAVGWDGTNPIRSQAEMLPALFKPKVN